MTLFYLLAKLDAIFFRVVHRGMKLLTSWHLECGYVLYPWGPYRMYGETGWTVNIILNIHLQLLMSKTFFLYSFMSPLLSNRKYIFVLKCLCIKTYTRYRICGWQPEEFWIRGWSWGCSLIGCSASSTRPSRVLSTRPWALTPATKTDEIQLTLWLPWTIFGQHYINCQYEVMNYDFIFYGTPLRQSLV